MRLRSIRAPLLLFFSLLGFTAQAQDAGSSRLPGWAVSVGSTFQSEIDGKDRPLRGGGVLVRVDGKLFVLCDSHLSQGGKDLKIRHASLGELKAVHGERLADNERDLELIEIEAPAGRIPAFEYSERDRIFSIPVPKDSHPFPFTHLKVGERLAVPVDRSLIRAKPGEWVKESGSRVRWTSLESLHEGVMDLSEDLDRAYGRLPRSYDHSQYVLDSAIVPGMSAEPLLSEKDGTLRLLGLVQGYDRNFRKSFFSTEEGIAALVSAFRAGKRGHTGPARWRYRDFTYRDFGNGVLEINPSFSPAGGPTSGDGGGPTSGDGGGPTSGDGGNSSGAERRDEDMTDWFARFGLEPGLKIQDRSVAAYRVTLPDGQKHLIFASKPALDFVSSLDSGKFKIEELELDKSDWLKLARERIQPARLDGPNHADTGACYIDLNALSNGKLRIRLPFSPGLSELSGTKPTVLEIDARSGLQTFRKFKAEDGTTTVVDLRGLYATDIASLRRKINFDRDVSPSEDILRTLGRHDRFAHLVLATGKSPRDTQYFCYGTRNAEYFKKVIRVSDSCEPKNAGPESGPIEDLFGWIHAITGENR